MSESVPQDMAAAHRVAIIGMGPRGVYALEHLTELLRKNPLGAPLDVHLIEPAELGPGSVWRTDQPRYLWMNTIASQVTAFGADDGASRGPTMFEWLQSNGVDIGPDDYPARADHGRYLAGALRDILERPVPHLSVHTRSCRAINVIPEGARHRVEFEDGSRPVLADVVLLTTGHSEHTSPDHDALQGFVRAQRERGLVKTAFVCSVYPVERTIEPLDETICLGILGLGLAGIDAIVAATLGKGGVFERDASGELVYHPSGREPRIVAWSRSGLPLAARAVNQKGVTGRHTARVFTKERIDALCAQAAERTGRAQLSFKDEVLPVLIEEMTYAYYTVLKGKDFAETYLATANDESKRRRLVSEVPEDERFDWETLIDPLKHKVFRTKGEFRTFLLDRIRKDIAEARKGNLGSPYKAACDVLRDLRGTLRAAYNFGRMTADSHRKFDQQFWPTHNRIAVGPPLLRIEQMVALSEAGVLDMFWGENPKITPCPERGCFRLNAWSFECPPAYIDVLANARVPQPDVRTDKNPLLENLLASGMIRPFKNATGHQTYVPCGIDITPRFNVIGADGKANPSLFAHGIMTEGPQLYTSVAASPGVNAKALVDAQGWAREVWKILHQGEESTEVPA